MFTTKQSTGIVIGRFQTPGLTVGHKYILTCADSQNSMLCVLITDKDAMSTNTDPLPFDFRKRMILDEFPQAKIFKIADHQSDKSWSEQIDKLIQSENFSVPQLYTGAKKLSGYVGRYGVKNFPLVESADSAALRDEFLNTPDYNHVFAGGIVYANETRLPAVYPTVDCVLYKKVDGSIYFLMGRHAEDDDDQLRYIGGFIQKSDRTAEGAFSRIVRTKASISAKNPDYICSIQVDDPRYKGSKDGIMTLVFGYDCKAITVTPTAGENIVKVEWVKINDVGKSIVPIHHAIHQFVLSFFDEESDDKPYFDSVHQMARRMAD